MDIDIHGHSELPDPVAFVVIVKEENSILNFGSNFG
jgi:hypothetical protein